MKTDTLGRSRGVHHGPDFLIYGLGLRLSLGLGSGLGSSYGFEVSFNVRVRVLVRVKVRVDNREAVPDIADTKTTGILEVNVRFNGGHSTKP